MNARDIEINVYTEREGLMSAVGHDLKLAVGEFVVRRDGDEVTIDVDASSVAVAACIVDGREDKVGMMDRKLIERNIQKDVLQARKHPRVNYRATVSRDGETAVVSGELTIRGTTKPVDFQFTEKGGRWTSSTTINQRDWGIEPYTAFMGALRLKEELRIEVVLASGVQP